LYICIVLLQEVGRLQKIFEESFFLINPDGVLPVGVFHFIKMAKEIQLTQGKVAIVDDDLFEYLNQWKWCACKISNRFYAIRSYRLNSKKIFIYMHRLITNNNDSKMHTDHKNNNPLDNRIENLRICTNSQNQMNTKVQINNTSGFKGVTWNKIVKKWVAQIKLNNKLINLGYYIDPIDAARAYNAAALKYHGEFAHLNKIN
jgi:hypothetical protein